MKQGRGGLGDRGTQGEAPILGSGGFKEDLFLFLPLASPSTQVLKPKVSTPSWVFLLPLLPQIHPCRLWNTARPALRPPSPALPPPASFLTGLPL